MEIQILDKDKICISSAKEVVEKDLIDFYREVFPDRVVSLESHWEWLNRTLFYDNKIPLVIRYESKVVAHSGMIPFCIILANEKYTASWFIDFKVIPEFQRYGLGTILTHEWMNFSDCCVTFCNEKSIGVFRKLGWVESYDTYMHLNFMLPFDHPGFVRRLPSFLRKSLNRIVYPFYYWTYYRFSYSSKNFNLESFNDRLFDEFYAVYLKNAKLIAQEPNFRDAKYVQWRILNSPNREKYHVYKVNDFRAIVSLQNNHGKYIDVLWVSDISNNIEITKMIASLGVFGLKNGYAYLRFFTNDKRLSDFIKAKLKSRVSHPRFAFFSKNKAVFEKLKSVQWNFELIDSDFEHLK